MSSSRSPARHGLDISNDPDHHVLMKQFTATKFKEQCLFLLDHLDGEGIVVTKWGQPVAKVIPIGRSSAHQIGCLKGKIKIKGDIYSTGLKWDVGS